MVDVMKRSDMNKLAQQVVDILEPRVGAIVAAAMVDKQCTSMGITPKILVREQLGALAKKIEHVLAIFGHDKEGIAEKIKALK